MVTSYVDQITYQMHKEIDRRIEQIVKEQYGNLMDYDRFEIIKQVHVDRSGFEYWLKDTWSGDVHLIKAFTYSDLVDMGEG